MESLTAARLARSVFLTVLLALSPSLSAEILKIPVLLMGLLVTFLPVVCSCESCVVALSPSLFRVLPPTEFSSVAKQPGDVIGAILLSDEAVGWFLSLCEAIG